MPLEIDFQIIESQSVQDNFCFGDYDQDGAVSTSDFTVFAQNYLQDNINCTLDLAGNNCRLDSADFAVFRNNYKNPNCAEVVVTNSNGRFSDKLAYTIDFN